MKARELTIAKISHNSNLNANMQLCRLGLQLLRLTKVRFAGCGLRATDCGLQVCGLQATDCRLRICGLRSQIAGYGPQVAGCGQSAG